YLILYFALGLGSLGLPFLVRIYVHDSWSATSVERGTVIMIAGRSVVIISNCIAALEDRFNASTAALVSLTVVVAGLLLIPFTNGAMSSTFAWCIVIVGAQATIISLNKQVLLAKRSDTLIALTQSMRFFGTAFAPLVVLPFYSVSALVGFG